MGGFYTWLQQNQVGTHWVGGAFGSACTSSSKMPWCGVVSGSHFPTESGFSSPSLCCQWAVEMPCWSDSQRGADVFCGMATPLPPRPFLCLTDIHPKRFRQSLDPGVSHLPFTRGAGGLVEMWTYRSKCLDPRAECHLWRQTIKRRCLFWDRIV